MPTLNLQSPITILPSVGEKYAEKLTKLGILTLDDLLHHYPFRYADLSLEKTIDTLEVGDTVTLSGTIIGIQSVHLKFGKTLQKATFSDGTGTMKISWFNQPYLAKALENNPQVSLSGTVKIFAGKPTLSSPQYEIIRNPTAPLLHSGRLVPVYPETAGVTSKWLRTKINTLLKSIDSIPEWLPETIVRQEKLVTTNDAIHRIHFPDSIEEAEAAKMRLSFDELLLWQLIAKIRKQQSSHRKNEFPISKDEQQYQTFINQLPFTLTSSQTKAITDIEHDLKASTPMNRLLQGDVGSGKTVVAAAAIYQTVKAGYKAIVMAPTEILALQHAKTIQSLLEPLGITIKVATKSRHDELIDADVVIGTQAVLFRELPDNVGLVVIDEQHRFGVNQRSILLKKDKSPHLLAMTATPIPRTIALTLYAELDISVIDEVPVGRLPIKTWVVSDDKREGAYHWIKDQIKSGGQAFIVCPLIEGSDDEAMSEIKAAESEYERLAKEIFPEYKVGLVHGKLKAKQKDAIINEFSEKKLDILVATPVVEVGIDIKGATIMVIEGAERFGLAALHQLRGRVGRNNQQAYCLLFTTHPKDNDKARLKALETTHSGFQLAELDLKLRGPGDLYGTHQSGFVELQIASLNDEALIRRAHSAAGTILDQSHDLTAYPSIQAKLDKLIENLAEPN